MFFHNLNEVVENKIVKYSGKIPLSKIKILITYSGGVDSSVLLDITNKLSNKMKFAYDFVYINHNMSLNNEKILIAAKNFSKKNNINFIYHNIIKTPSSNKESFYRTYRYHYFDKLRKINNYNFIFTAHHIDDQLETIYMKTTGIYDWTNLLGIRESKDAIRRPLLNIKKKTIIKYAIKNNINWIFDHTNNNSDILRNNIRNNILPKMSQYSKTQLYLLHINSKIKLYIYSFKYKYFRRMILYKTNNYTVIDKISFLNLNDRYKKIFIQSIFKKHNNNKYLILNNKKWTNLWEYLNKNKNLKDFELSNNIIVNNSKTLIILKNFKRYKKKSVLSNNKKWEKSIFKIKKVNKLSSVWNKNIFYITEKQFDQGIYIRNWNIGDFYISVNKNKRKVSKLFNKNKFNNFNKMIHPLILNNKGEIVWVPGLAYSESFNIHKGNNNYIKISREIVN